MTHPNIILGNLGLMEYVCVCVFVCAKGMGNMKFNCG